LPRVWRVKLRNVEFWIMNYELPATRMARKTSKCWILDYGLWIACHADGE